MVKTGKTKNRKKSLLSRLWKKSRPKEEIETIPVLENDRGRALELVQGENSSSNSADSTINDLNGKVHHKSAIEKFAFDHISRHLPKVPRYRGMYDQSGLHVIFESYMSTAILLTLIAFVLGLIASALILLLLRYELLLALLYSLAVGCITLAISMSAWTLYPLQRRRSLGASLEAQLPYSFGIMGVLSASGMNIERMFERMALSDSNPALSSLARRFVRNIKIFGLDTENALREVARHSPSNSFAKMLESIAVAFRTTGSVHDLIMFESTRLLTEKNDRLKKKISDLAIMAELYITLVVVGPIIFIVMLSILQLLPYSGSIPTIPIINAVVFVGIPVISVGFTLMLDSMVSRM